jgi:hypothetical protein
MQKLLLSSGCFIPSSQYHCLVRHLFYEMRTCMSEAAFTYRITSGWLRDLATEPTPHDPWPCIRWDEQLLDDQIQFLDVQAELGVTSNLVWGLFVDRAWPVPFENVIDLQRAEMLQAFVSAAHARNIKIITGVGIYSWGFDQVIKHVPGVSRGHQHAMCPFCPKAWDWQRRVLDFLMDPRWRIDGISMQSADQGRCECEDCSNRSPAEHHADVLVRSAEYVRANRPDWQIGQASWGLKIDSPEEFHFVQQISTAVDYMIEVRELSKHMGRRREIIEHLNCAFGTVAGVFVEPPQHWERLRWFLPCGLASARSLLYLWQDGGRACEYYYRPFANPVEEVSWRTGAQILMAPERLTPEQSLGNALEAVYGVTGANRDALVEWFARGENAYFSHSNFEIGQGPLSLEPLVWDKNPAAAGPPIYLRDRMGSVGRTSYARELESLKAELTFMEIPNPAAKVKTIAAINGTLHDIELLV